MPLMPRKLLVQQGTTAAPVKTPAEDWRLASGALWTPSGTQLQERSGVVAGSGPSAGVEPLAVTAAAGGVFTIQPGRFYVQGASALQGGYVGVVDAVTTRTIPGTSLPGSGQFKAGFLIAHVYDQVYGDTQDGYDLEFVLGAAASTQAGAAYPALAGSYLQLRSFTVDSTGTVTLNSYLPNFTVPRGGINVARTTDLTNGAYVGQYRDHPTQGLQRWDGTGWRPVAYGQVRGKMWRTAAFSGALTTSTAYAIGMQSARLSGGFTWGGGDNVAGGNSYLTVPFDGLYDVSYSAYVTGGAASVFAISCSRLRGGNLASVGYSQEFKASGAVDHQAQRHTSGVPLAAGDQLFNYLTIYTNSGATLTFYGISEASGSGLAATYAGPLNGATPL